MASKKTKLFLPALSLALLLAGCGENFYDENAEDGLLAGRTEEEITALQNQDVADGMLQVSINANPVFLNGKEPGNLRIENAPGNHYDMRVVITLNETGKEIYTSGGIKPNQHIENDTLDVTLGPGDHEATVKFYAVDEEHKDLGLVKQEITLTVLE